MRLSVTINTKFTISDRHPIPAMWFYTPAAPLVVTLTVVNPRDETVNTWNFARSLLTDAFDGELPGQGDVRLTVAGPELQVVLSSTGGRAHLRGDSERAREFLRQTCALCPPCIGTDLPWHAFCRECTIVNMALDRALEQIVREATT